MLVTYQGPEVGRKLAPNLGGTWLPRGVPVEVPDRIARALARQSGFIIKQGRRRRAETPEKPVPTMEVRHGKSEDVHKVPADEAD